VRQNKREKKNILKICTILKNILFQQRSRSDDKPIRFPSYVIRVIESVPHCQTDFSPLYLQLIERVVLCREVVHHGAVFSTAPAIYLAHAQHGATFSRAFELRFAFLCFPPIMHYEMK